MTDEQYVAQRYRLEMRHRVLVNTDPQRRCYWGAHAKSELQWTSWTVLERWSDTAIGPRRLKFWQELNDYAVSQRGETAKTEYRIIDTEVPA